MPLHPITAGGQPNPQGLWERARILQTLYYGEDLVRAALLNNLGVIYSMGFEPVNESQAAAYWVCEFDDQLLVGVLGTQTATQMVAHVVGAMSPRIIDSPSYVNAFFEATAELILSSIMAQLEVNPPWASVEIFGHSYGAGVAGLLAYQIGLIRPGLALNVATYGSPRSRGGPAYAPAPRSWVRVRNQGDLVTVLPPAYSSVVSGALPSVYTWSVSRLAPWVQDGTGVLLTAPSTFNASYSDATQDLAVYAEVDGTDPVAAHSIVSYATILRAQPLVRDPSSPPAPEPAPGPMVQGMIPALPDGPSSPALVADANSLYYGATAGPLTAGNYGSLQLSAVSVSAAKVGSPTNIANSSGGASMSTGSGYTKVSMCINNGTYGRTESHVVSLNINNPSILAPVIAQLCRYRAACLGNSLAGLTIPPGKSLGTPQIEFVKLTDAVQPKLGYVLDVRAQNYFGYSTSGGIPTDTAFTALTLRLTGQQNANYQSGTGGTFGIENSTLQLTEGPDNAVVNGVFIPTASLGGANTIAGNINTYVNYLAFSGNVLWGFSGLAANQPPNQIAAWTQPGGVYTITPTNNVYSTGDRVVITGASPVFNKTWTINVNAGLITLRNPPVSGHTLPTGGTMRRVAVAGGFSAKGFYPYQSVQLSGAGIPAVKVSKKNPGREFLNVSFRSRRRRER